METRMADWFTDYSGASPNFRSRRWRALGAVLDPLFDLSLQLQGVSSIHRTVKSRRILIVGVEVPSRPGDIHKVLSGLTRTSRHSVELVTIPMAEGVGKFANVERALATVNFSEFDWLVIADDDISFGKHTLDRLIALSEAADLKISQPAHKRSSVASYQVTLRKPRSFARETHFVEIGPMTAFHKSVFDFVIPFPRSRWCYGIDILWSEIARKNGFKIGIVDAATIRHLRPVANSYNIDRAIAEGEAFINGLQVPRTRRDVLAFEEIVLPTPVHGTDTQPMN